MDEKHPKWIKITKHHFRDIWYGNYIGDIFRVREVIRGGVTTIDGAINVDNYHSDEDRDWWVSSWDCMPADGEIEKFNQRLQKKCKHDIFLMTCPECYKDNQETEGVYKDE